MRMRSCIAALFVVTVAMPAWAEEQRPAPTAELLMARYASGGTSIFAQPGTILKTVPGIAIYSDGTVLIAEAQMMLLPLSLRMVTISPDVAQARFRKFYDDLADAAPNYHFNCWSIKEDGRSVPGNCIDDAGTATSSLSGPMEFLTRRFLSMPDTNGECCARCEISCRQVISISWPGWTVCRTYRQNPGRHRRM